MSGGAVHTALELEPCPFCGGSKVRVKTHGSSDYWGHCKDCFADGPMEPTRDEAVAIWNVRSSAPTLKAQAEALREEVTRLQTALVTLQDHAGRVEAEFKTRLGERGRPTWFAVNAMQDFVGFVRMWEECHNARAALSAYRGDSNWPA